MSSKPAVVKQGAAPAMQAPGKPKQSASTASVPAAAAPPPVAPLAAGAAEGSTEATKAAASTFFVPPTSSEATKTTHPTSLPLGNLSPTIQNLRTTFQLLSDQEFESEVEIERKRRQRRRDSSLKKKQQKPQCPPNNNDNVNNNSNNNNSNKRKTPPPPVEAADATAADATAADATAADATAAAPNKDNDHDDLSSTANNNKNLPINTSSNKKRKANVVTAAMAPTASGAVVMPPYMYHYPYHPYHHPAAHPYPMMGSYPAVQQYYTATTAATAPPPPPPVAAAAACAIAASSLPSPPKEQPIKEDCQQQPAKPKRKYRKKSKMTEGSGDAGEPAAAASKTNVVSKEQKWETKLLELQKFKADHGHLNVSSLTSTSEAYKLLYDWIVSQKRHWNRFLQGDFASSKLTPEKIQKLIDVGLGTISGPTSNKKELDERAWDEHFTNLVKYKNEHGNMDLIKGKKGQQCEELQKLAGWVDTQRSNFARRQHRAATGVKKRGACMTDTQLERLASIGFRFTNKTSTFEERFQQISEYKAVHGDTKVPVSFKGYNNLGRWVTSIKDAYWNKTVLPERVEKLNEIGFDWSLRSGPNAHKT